MRTKIIALSVIVGVGLFAPAMAQMESPAASQPVASTANANAANGSAANSNAANANRHAGCEPSAPALAIRRLTLRPQRLEGSTQAALVTLRRSLVEKVPRAMDWRTRRRLRLISKTINRPLPRSAT